MISIKVLFAQSSSGGHIYPAISFNNFLKSKFTKYSSKFIIQGKDIENKILSNEDTYNLNINFNKKLLFINNLVLSYIRIKRLIKNYKPDLVISCGGNIGGITIYIANKFKIRTMIHEQNFNIGLANKLNLKYVDIFMTTFDLNIKKQYIIGNPRTYELLQNKEECKKNIITVLTGSQGSEEILDFIENNVNKFYEYNYIFYIVTSYKYYSKYKYLNKRNIKIIEYSDDIENLYNKSKIVISRAGATTFDEIINFKIPSIFIPSPYVKNNHQYKNLKKYDCKNIFKIIEQKNISDLFNTINELLIEYKSYESNLNKLDIINTKSKFLEVVDNIIS